MEQRNLDDDMTKDIAKWPADWDLHIIKTVNLILDKRDEPCVVMEQISSSFKCIAKGNIEKASELTYEQLRQSIIAESVTIRGLFVCGGRYYITTFVLDDDEISAIGSIFVLLAYVDNLDELDLETSVVPADIGFYIAEPVAIIHGSSGYEVVTSMEKEIIDDYWRRGGDNGDDEPELDPDPTPSDSIKPINS